MLSLVRQLHTWSPWHPHPSHLLCLSLPGSSSSLQGLGTFETPASITHRAHTPSPPQLLFFFFFFFYTVTSSRRTGSALATPPLAPSPEVPGMARQGAGTDAHFSFLTRLRPTSALSGRALCTCKDGYRKSANGNLCSILARPDMRTCVESAAW